MKERSMEENNVHTSVVIELASQEEPEDQKTYKIDIDDVDTPKDYVIDQIFCGDNVTVYALFEVPEGSSKNSEKHFMEMSSPSLHEEYNFFHKNSFKKLKSEIKPNGYKQNLCVMHSEDDMSIVSSRDSGNRSFYCLKHLDGNYEMLTPEKKHSELKVLYSKEVFSKTSMSTKFKAVSKGVNTDIVQSPRIIKKVQKAVGLNIPYSKIKRKTIDVKSASSSSPSYEVIEMEMRQSFSSLSSEGSSRKCTKKSVPNFFLVPLLMMEDGVLSHFQMEDKIHKFVEDTSLDSKTLIAPKVSFGTNTDLMETKPLEFESKEKTEENPKNKSQLENYTTDLEAEKIEPKKKNSNSQLKPSSKETILKEIKKMQGKLNELIKTIESNEFESDLKEDEITESDSKTYDGATEILDTASETLLAGSETFLNTQRKYDERPIFLPLSYSAYSNKTKAKPKQKSEKANEEKPVEGEINPAKSVSIGFISGGTSYTSETIKEEEKPRIKPKKPVSTRSIKWQELENWKGAGLSKSETNARVFFADPKCNLINGIKKSLSSDLRDDKVDILKKIKNFSLNFEGSVKTKADIRILQSNEGQLGDNVPLTKCEMGDDINQKAIKTKVDVATLAQKTETIENLKEIHFDAKKNLNEEEGDAKLVYPKEALLEPAFVQKKEEVQVHYCSTSTKAPDDLFKVKKSLSPCRVRSKIVTKNVDPGTKVINEPEKPKTPNKNFRKATTPEPSVKKDVKPIKKPNNKAKVAEKPTKPETKDVTVTHPEGEKRKLLGDRRKAVRNNGESRLHVDKLFRPDISGNYKPSQSAKCNDEKQNKGALSRLSSQKRESAEHPTDVPCEEIKETENKISRKKSVTSAQVESDQKKNAKENVKPATAPEKTRTSEDTTSTFLLDNPLSLTTNPSSVVLELLSKKPTSAERFYSTLNQEVLEQTPIVDVPKNEPETEPNENSVNLEKPIVKSVWALTKVLLFEDGTKKLEVLEASLTPPGFSLNQQLKTEDGKMEN